VNSIAEILAKELVYSVFQPIVDLDSDAVVAYEALARGPVGDLQRPDHLFAAAAAAGRLSELDGLCQRAALRGAIRTGILAPLTLFINVEPEVVDPARLDSLLSIAKDCPGNFQLMLEITERALAVRPADLLATVRRLRAAGWRIALDDVGADDLSLAFMPLLRPDVIKLDMALVQRRPGRKVAEIMNAVNSYAERTGSVILAEGIETADHLAKARALGATLGQGWWFGRPAEGPVPGRPSRALRLPPLQPVPVEMSPFQFLPESVTLRRTTKALLIQVSKHLEREARRLGRTCVVVSTFQHATHFTPSTARRYQDLAEQVGFVAAIGAELQDEPVPGVRGADLEPGDPVRMEWDIVVLAPHFAAALIARDLTPANGDGDDNRFFEFALTYDRKIVEAAARSLMSRVRPNTMHGILGPAVAVPLTRRIIRGVAPPLMALSAVVRGWRDGDRSARADEDTGVLEVRDVARGFNSLTRGNSIALDEVAERNRLTEAVVTIARDVRETLAADEVTSRIIGPIFRAMSADAIWLRILPGAQVSGPGVGACIPDADPRMRASPALISMAGDLATELWHRQETLRLQAGEERSPNVVKSVTFAAILEMSDQVGISSVVVVPLGAGAECVGYLILGRAPTGRPWSVPEADALGQMGRDIGRAIVEARTFEREREAVQKVLALDLQKSDFVSMVSHELRTPLTSISGYLELIRDGDTGVVPPKVTELLAVVERNTFRLRQLIEDLLILSNIESRTLRSEQLPVDLHQICQEARTVAAQQAASRQIAVTFDSRLDPVTVRGDREQLEQVVGNLLDNAVKFSRTGGRVQLRLGTDGDSAVVVCADDGIGIPAVEKDQLGTRFFRASNATAKAVQGTGLGLAIVRRILDQHGGTINIESVEGSGTTAEIRIPLASTLSPATIPTGHS